MFNSLPVALGCLHNPVNYPVHLFFHDLYSALIAFSYFFFKKNRADPHLEGLKKISPSVGNVRTCLTQISHTTRITFN